jgi:hypothetical protein
LITKANPANSVDAQEKVSRLPLAPTIRTANHQANNLSCLVAVRGSGIERLSNR